MNILVVGSGYLGRSVAEKFQKMGHDISIIDENEEKINALSPDFQGLTFVGFPMDINNLINAGIESCDAVLVTTSDDNLNIAVGQIANNIFKIENVVSRISDPYREHVFENFDLRTVCPTNMACDSMLSAIFKIPEDKLINFGSNVLSFKTLPSSKKLIGKDLRDIEFNDDENPFGLIKNTGKFIQLKFNSTLIIEENDTIVYTKTID